MTRDLLVCGGPEIRLSTCLPCRIMQGSSFLADDMNEKDRAIRASKENEK